ncbi:hypothetical protein [Rufibacter sp. LB8]|uniref:hypothetical protein n=1 Tax=Rufibacter sp. LB8 TaxID=2777781 RepID=UPI00178C805E|nr:hypothetical protein [Rufibacter sp. LB8]
MLVKLLTFKENNSFSTVRRIFTAFCLFIFLSGTAAMAQGLEEDESYTREFTYGLNFNTNGGLLGGAMVKQVYLMQGKWYQFWGLEAVEVKHPKEVQYQNRYTGSTFVKGKRNYFFALRPNYGREYTFFKKAAESGVQVNGIFAAGPSIAVLGPYYIDYNYTRLDRNGQPIGPVDVRAEPYDPNIHTDLNRIVGGSGVFTGLSEPSFKVGAHVKAGVSFEYGRYMESVTGIEVGMLYEMFPSRIIIVQGTGVDEGVKNQNRFFSLYLTLYYGHRR